MTEAGIMKRKVNYNLIYKKLLRMRPEKPVAESLEYKVLARAYPHLAESIRLKKEMERLKERLRPVKGKPMKLHKKVHIPSLVRRFSVASRKFSLLSALDLKSMYVAERSLALREWLHKHHKKPSRKLIASTWPRKKSPMLIAEKVNKAEKNRESNVA